MNSTQQPLFGFILSGIGLGIVVAVTLAYGPDYLYGAYEFPSVSNTYYWLFSLSVPPVVGFAVGLLTDISIQSPVVRRDLLNASWKFLTVASVILLLFGLTYSPVY